MISCPEAQEGFNEYISHLDQISKGMNKGKLMLELDEIDEVINN
jgi:soluble cytochrome b562